MVHTEITRLRPSISCGSWHPTPLICKAGVVAVVVGDVIATDVLTVGMGM